MEDIYIYHVIRATSKRTVYKIISEDCETIIILVTIYADSSTIPPLIIF